MAWIKDGARLKQRYYDWCNEQSKGANEIGRCDGHVTGPFGAMSFPDAFIDELKRMGIPFELYNPALLTCLVSPMTTGFSNLG